jgi:acyl-coenzyme A synthetase/AMP-(fatty) acid ligase
VVLRAGACATKHELEAHYRARLAGFKTPRIWRFVSELPRTASGKVMRRALVDSSD